ncbi:MAG: DUF3795 domain-containing protein [Candidatus Bathyarchaeota archaeon]|nr:MAG: DUF3795 domain-containing protein [Candidatus Bathyarchaeota archaeon]
MIAYCGLDCSECEAYAATQDNDFKALVALAKKWGENHDTSYKPEDIECEGCQSDRLNKYCITCGVRCCGVNHGFETCAECRDYPCDKLGKEWKSWNMADWTKVKVALDERSSEGD